MAVRVAGDKRFLLPFRGIHGALHRADIAAVDMNTDRDAIRQRIADAMNIAIVSGDFLHLACFQKRGGAQRARYAIGIQLVALVFLRAAQHPNGPHTRWSWIGVACPGPQTKLTIEKRSPESACSRYCW